MKFTKEEISLCKQITERHRKKIEYGDWVYKIPSQSGAKILGLEPCPSLLDGLRLYSKSGSRLFACDNELSIERWFPLWTISDCLEFLEEKGLNLYFQFMCFPNGNWRFTAEDNRYGKVRGEGKTRLEACLKAVLAVLEEEK